MNDDTQLRPLKGIISIELPKEELMWQFYGAVKTRIADCQKALWSRFIGAGFIAEDILGYGQIQT